MISSMTLPEDGVSRWKKQIVAVDAYDDWPPIFGSPDAHPLEKTAPKIGALLKALPKRARDLCGVREDGGTLEMAAVLADDPFALFGPWIAAGLRAASRTSSKTTQSPRWCLRASSHPRRACG